MRIPRKTKKKLRACFLCLTGNPDCKKSKYSKKDWVILKNDFKTWISDFNMLERKTANKIK